MFLFHLSHYFYRIKSLFSSIYLEKEIREEIIRWMKNHKHGN